MGAIGAKFCIFYLFSCRTPKKMSQFYVIGACGIVVVLEFQEIQVKTVAIHSKHLLIMFDILPF